MSGSGGGEPDANALSGIRARVDDAYVAASKRTTSSPSSNVAAAGLNDASELGSTTVRF